MVKRIVVGADSGAAGVEAVRRAAALLAPTGGTMHIVTGYRSSKSNLTTAAARHGWSAGPQTEATLDRLAAMPDPRRISVVTHPMATTTVEAISTIANQERADLIVVAHHRDRRRRRLRRSVSRALTKRAPCAVMIVPVP